MAYKAPVDDILFTLDHVAGFSEHLSSGAFGDLDHATVEAVLDEAGRFAAEELAPINRSGDEQRAQLIDGEVVLPPGWKEAYRQIRRSGLERAALPRRNLAARVCRSRSPWPSREMWNAANMAFGLNPLLTQAGDRGAVQIRLRRAEERHICRRWSRASGPAPCSSPNPMPGSDLRFLKTRAVPAGRRHLPHQRHQDLHHLRRASADREHHPHRACAPARRPARHAGHLDVPRAEIPGEWRRFARRRATMSVCAKLEHKLGIHGSPTCVLNYGERAAPIGWMIGEPNRGLQYMFTMMNQARLGGRACRAWRWPSMPSSTRSPMRATAGRAASDDRRRRHERRSSTIPMCAACCCR